MLKPHDKASKTKTLKKKLKLKLKRTTQVNASAANSDDVKQAKDASTEPTQIDLIPWTFKRPDKVTIKRDKWNTFVKRIQATVVVELEAENLALNEQLRDVLNQRDEYAAKYKEMAEYVSKFTRSFDATYGV